jgi:membrane fusion protein (multidrug efflux system)
MTQESPDSRPFRRRAAILIVLISGVIGISILGFQWWRSGRYLESTDDAYVGGDVTAITPRVAGYVTRVLVGDNTFVHAGQSLLELDAADFQARVDSAEAVVAAADATVSRVFEQQALDHANVEAAQADLAVAQAAARFAVTEAQRYSRLASTEAGTDQDAQRHNVELEQAQARERAAAAIVTARTRQLSVTGARFAEARAQLNESRAALHAAQLNRGYTTLYSPIDGYIGNRSARPGTFVPAGTQLMSIVPAHGLWVDANFKEDQIRHLRVGQPVRIKADVDSGLSIAGRVASLAPATGSVFSIIPAQNATGNFTRIVQRVPVRIELEPLSSTLGALRAGLSVTVTVDAREGGS